MFKPILLFLLVPLSSIMGLFASVSQYLPALFSCSLPHLDLTSLSHILFSNFITYMPT